MSFLPNDLPADLGPRFLVERALGHGPLGKSYLVRDLESNGRVVLKVMNRALTAGVDSDVLEQGLGIRALQHPNMLSVLDSGVTNGQLWYTIPYVEAESLHDRLAREGVLAPSHVLRITEQLAELLDFAYERGLPQFNVRPEKVFLSKQRTLLEDSALARAFQHLSGERLRGRLRLLRLDPSTMADSAASRPDVQDLGRLTHHMWTGEQEPEPGESAWHRAIRRARRVLSRKPRRMLEPAIEMVLENAVSPVPVFASAKTFAEAFEHGVSETSYLGGIQRIQVRHARGARPSRASGGVDVGGTPTKRKKKKGARRSAERRISVWLSERPSGETQPLRVSEVYTLNVKVGRPEAGSLLAGPDAVVPDSDVPPEGLATLWQLIGHDVDLAPLSPRVGVERLPIDSSEVWLARFPLTIPSKGDSDVVSLRATPRRSGAWLEVRIFTRSELYRQFEITLGVEGKGQLPKPIGKRYDLVKTPAAHLDLRTSHEWTTPPGQLNIVIGTTTASVVGDTRKGLVNTIFLWNAAPALVSGRIDNVRSSAEGLRQRWESYLNDVDPADLTQRLARAQREYDWSRLSDHADPVHHAAWAAVESSTELRDLAFDGYALFNTLFPPGTELRGWLEDLLPGHRVNISWHSAAGGGWVPNVPWGLMYLREPPDPGEPVDPLTFAGLRLRLEYTAYPIKNASKALGRPDQAHRLNYLYWGAHPLDPIAREALVQRNMWSGAPRRVLVPPQGTPAQDARAHLVRLIKTPVPAPVAVLYFFCQCTVGAGNEPQLRFSDASADILRRSELGTQPFDDRPFVFANACTTGGGDPFVASELQRSFFDRHCRGYLGTETKVPIALASRFGALFFSFFEREVDAEPMAAGEAVAQARLFLWTNYRNIGGLFYTYANQYELFMADEQEILALRS
jgi:hypothetical protein